MSSVTSFTVKRNCCGELNTSDKANAQSTTENNYLRNIYATKNEFLLRILVHILLDRFQPIRDLEPMLPLGPLPMTFSQSNLTS